MAFAFRAVEAALLCALAGGARAETFNAPIETLLGVATVYFGEDARKSRAVLVDNKESDADLRVYQEAKDADPDKRDMKLTFTKKAVAFTGPMGGQEASLEVSARGSLIVKSLNIGIGRNKWEKAITIVQKGGVFQVVGITFASHDGLDPKAGGACDLNLATGRGMRNGKPVSFIAAPIKLVDWSDEKMPKECAF